MSGFYITNCNQSTELINYMDERCKKEDLLFSYWTIKINLLKKFAADKLFFQHEAYIILLDGVILNKCRLMKMTWSEDWGETLVQMIEANPYTFYRVSCGSFSGAVYLKTWNKWLVFTNHVGDKAVFYYTQNDVIVIRSQLNYLPLTLNERAAYDMLTFEFMETDGTYAKEIKRLQVDQDFRVSAGKILVCTYYQLEKGCIPLRNAGQDDWVRAFDDVFKNFLGLALQKDEEYGCHHLSDLSGGLDARMTAWVAKTFFTQEMASLTYAQSASDDEVIAERMAEYLGAELIFKLLNDAAFLFEPDLITGMNSGLALYGGITGEKRLLEQLNFEYFGLEHTGQLGDVVLGSFCKPDDYASAPISSGMYSRKMTHHIDPAYYRSFADKELYLMRTRAFNGALSNHFIQQNYTEVYSPFIDPDVLDLAFPIPIEMQAGHKIYHTVDYGLLPGSGEIQMGKYGYAYYGSAYNPAFQENLAQKTGPHMPVVGVGIS